ncbi:MAG: hypothetical protein QNJ35_15325 [Paracoccaceae bacterium]|nr:hypothetical protein [Paracoccaceae bacterium]
MSSKPHLVAIGGFRLRSPLLAPAFFWFAAPALSDARNAPGCVMADARAVYGRQFSLSVWESPAAMRAYAGSPRHARAMRAASWLGSGPFAHFATTEPVTWEEALEVWRMAHEPALSPAARAR